MCPVILFVQGPLWSRTTDMFARAFLCGLSVARPCSWRWWAPHENRISSSIASAGPSLLSGPVPAIVLYWSRWKQCNVLKLTGEGEGSCNSQFTYPKINTTNFPFLLRNWARGSLFWAASAAVATCLKWRWSYEDPVLGPSSLPLICVFLLQLQEKKNLQF